MIWIRPESNRGPKLRGVLGVRRKTAEICIAPFLPRTVDGRGMSKEFKKTFFRNTRSPNIGLEKVLGNEFGDIDQPKMCMKESVERSSRVQVILHWALIGDYFHLECMTSKVNIVMSSPRRMTLLLPRFTAESTIQH